jgi:NAD(P)H dehydrogenase (quinone)
MRHIIILAHPNSSSFSASICQHLAELSSNLGNDVIVRDLYQLKFNPVLSADDLKALHSGKLPRDIAEEQKWVASADLISLIFPLWWTGYPAILKGWIDRVLLNGFAFKHSAKNGIEPLLTGKKIQIITTMGASVDEYEQNGLMEAMAMTMGDNVWSFCGCDDAGMIVFGEVPGMGDKERMTALREIESSLVAALVDEEPTKPKTPAKTKAKKSAPRPPAKKETSRKPAKKQNTPSRGKSSTSKKPTAKK